MRSILQLAVLVALCAWGSAQGASGEKLSALVRDGDIIFHTSRSSQSLAIQRATGSPYSHVGMVLFRGGRPFVLEAVQTVRYTPLDRWVARGEGGQYVVKRLAEAERVMTGGTIKKLRDQARRFEGKAYDLIFEWSDENMYCSELVWKIYDRTLGVQVGRLQKLKSFRLDDPEVRSKLRERYGASLPLEEPVISPGDMFDARNLVEVTRR